VGFRVVDARPEAPAPLAQGGLRCGSTPWLMRTKEKGEKLVADVAIWLSVHKPLFQHICLSHFATFGSNRLDGRVV
jgi:hypothetical protein